MKKMTTILQFLQNIKTLVGKYHYTKTQSDAKYIILDDLNDAIVEELTPVVTNPNVTVNATGASTVGLKCILTDINDVSGTDYLDYQSAVGLNNGTYTFTNVTAGDYYLVLLDADDYIVSVEQITVATTNITASFTVRNINVDAKTSEGQPASDASLSMYPLGLNPFYRDISSGTSILLCDGQYESSDGYFYNDGMQDMSVTINEYTSTISIFADSN